MILYSIYYIQRNQAVFRSSQHQVLVPGFSLRNFALGKKSALLSSWAQPTELLRWPPEAARLAADIRLLPRSTWEVDPSVHLRRRPSRKFGKLGAFKKATFVFWSTPKKIKKRGWRLKVGETSLVDTFAVQNPKSWKIVVLQSLFTARYQSNLPGAKRLMTCTRAERILIGPPVDTTTSVLHHLSSLESEYSQNTVVLTS